MPKSSYITPNCCDNAKTLNVIILRLNAGEPRWFVKGRHPKHRYKDFFEVTFCPFCGKTLPEVEKDPTPKKIYDGDGYYCDTCGDRANECQCLPPSHQYKVKNHQPYDPNTELGKDMLSGEYGAPCDPKRFGE